MQRIHILFALILSLIPAVTLRVGLFSVPSALAAPQADVTNDQPVIEFPNTITFHANITASANITAVVLEYGTEQLTCGDVIAKAFPDFNEGNSINVEWSWDMRQSGSLPPGATIWWRWRYTDETGRETLSDQKTITWLDDVHNWQTITSGQLSLHSYGIDKSFAQEMLNAGLTGLERNEKDAGLKTKDPINIYVFSSYDDLREAILYEPSWTGGLAYPEHDIVIMGLSGSDSTWDQNTVIHELTHVLIGHLTFSCLGDVPTWLNEGLAMYSEGELDLDWQAQLDDAIRDDTLLTVRSLSAGFSEVSEKANLSYGQSFSIVKFLIETHGQDKMTALLTALRDGATVEAALIQTYGFNIDGLEAEWRKSIGAQPGTVSAQPTAQPTPTYVPTIIPISGAPLVAQITSTPIPTSSFEEQPTQEPVTRGRPPLALTLILLGFCCIILLILGIIVLGFFVRNQNAKGGNNG